MAAIFDPNELSDTERELLMALTLMTVHFYGTKSPHHQFVSWGEAAFEQMRKFGLMDSHDEWTEAGKEFVSPECDAFIREGWVPTQGKLSQH